MKIALTVIARVNAIEIEKRFEMEVVEVFMSGPIDENDQIDPEKIEMHDPVLEGFATLTKAYINGSKSCEE